MMMMTATRRLGTMMPMMMLRLSLMQMMRKRVLQLTMRARLKRLAQASGRRRRMLTARANASASAAAWAWLTPPRLPPPPPQSSPLPLQSQRPRWPSRGAVPTLIWDVPTLIWDVPTLRHMRRRQLSARDPLRCCRTTRSSSSWRSCTLRQTCARSRARALTCAAHAVTACCGACSSTGTSQRPS